MSNGISDMFESGFEAIKGFGEDIAGARYKTDDPILTPAQEESYLESIRDLKLKRLKESYPDTPESDLVVEAERQAQKDLERVKKDQLSLFGQLTTPKALTTGLGIVAAIMAGRESQRRYDDYMKRRPKYDPGQNPFMADGGGIQAFADGNKVEPIGQKRLSEMMIMNMKEKPMSFLMKSMAAGYAPEDIMGILSFFGMKDGGTPEFPRMTGNIEGPGTGTSDSIPAMLSDGEHVLTKQEVSQIGGGNNDLGHQRLYAMRQDLRSKARSNGIGRM